MPVHPSWDAIALRLLLAVAASAVIGVNRGEHGRPAGMRTTILVGVAAAIAMIEANLLLDTGGKKPDSFIVMDLMRLPLGILSGMGFIGAGAILRRGDTVIGITTAATLWFVTVMGLCFGGGQIALGAATLVIGVFVLWTLKWVEESMGQESRGELLVTLGDDGPSDAEIQSLLVLGGFKILNYGLTLSPQKSMRKVRCAVRYQRRAASTSAPAAIAELSARPGVQRITWRP